MMPLAQLARTLPLPALADYDARDAFARRDEIKRLIAAELRRHPSAHWLERLRPADVWCAEVLDWPRLLQSEAFGLLDMLQTVRRGDGTPVRTTRAPLRIDGTRASSPRGAPRVGEHSARLRAEFGL
jgi:crotonobetainyl-CoA:carnitine CoA-transferase CaiB-like acyl-CoA transferase